MSKLLFDEQPLIVSRELAKLIGLNEANEKLARK